MLELASHQLEPGPLRGNIYHGSGELLHEAGESIGSEEIQAMQSAGIMTLYLAEVDEQAGEFIRKQRFEVVESKGLKAGEISSTSLFAPDGSLIVNAGEEISSVVIVHLLDKGVPSLLREYPAEQICLGEVREYFRLCGSARTIGADLFRQPLMESASAVQELKSNEGKTETCNRQHERHDTKLQAMFRVRRDGKPEKQRPGAVAEVVNISRGGLLFRSPSLDIQIGEIIDMIMKTEKNEKQAFTLRVQHVVQVDEKFIEIGAKFLSTGSKKDS